MGHTPHELHEDFPSAADKIHALKARDQHFAKLANAYHELNRAVHRMESGVEPVADQTLEELKKKRVELKDRIAQILSRAA